MKKLKLHYRNMKDRHNKMGQGHRVEILGSSCLATLTSHQAFSITANQDEEAEVDEGEEEKKGETSLEQNSSLATQEDSAAGSQVDLLEAQEPSSFGTPPPPSVISTPTDIKGKTRMLTKDEKIEAVMKIVVKKW